VGEPPEVAEEAPATADEPPATTPPPDEPRPHRRPRVPPDEPAVTEAPAAERPDATPRATEPAPTAAPAPATPVAAARRGRGRPLLLAGLLALVALVGIVAVTGALDRGDDQALGEPAVEVPDAAPGDPQPALTVVTTRQVGGSTQVATIALLAVDRESGQGTVLLVPPATIADVPGHGSFRLGEAYDFGGSSLVGVSLDNLLGVRADGVVTVSEAGWSAWLDRLEVVEVTLPSAAVADDGTTRVAAGTQQLRGEELAAALTARSPDESQLDQLPRVQGVLTGLLDRFRTDPPALDTLFAEEVTELEVVGTAGAPDGEAEADIDLVRTLLAELTNARDRDDLTTLTLPVSPLGTGTEDAYRADAERVGSLVDDRLAASRPDPGVAGGRTLQLLNGNGIPGIGAEVAAVLQPAGYRVLLTGNADRFTYEATRIVVYDEDPATLAAARDVRDRLGVGEIERSGTPQSVVDLTIVIGQDFPVGGASEQTGQVEGVPIEEPDGEDDEADDGDDEDG
jgi:polyisoprenyl-teichoic acid--peptidoglycan teichoic acid transferase